MPESGSTYTTVAGDDDDDDDDAMLVCGCGCAIFVADFFDWCSSGVISSDEAFCVLE